MLSLYFIAFVVSDIFTFKSIDWCLLINVFYVEVNVCLSLFMIFLFLIRLFHFAAKKSRWELLSSVFATAEEGLPTPSAVKLQGSEKS